MIPVALQEDRYVAAFEFRPGNPRVVHHVDMRTDQTRGSRELDALDEEPGFDGIFGGSALTPGGVFLGWTPGRTPAPADPDVAWPLRDGVDFIFQMHLQPSGKPESIQASLGIHFADKPPSSYPYAISIGCRFFDIPPGSTDYTDFLREIALREDGPSKAKALMYLALTYHARGMADKTEDALRRAVEMQPDLARARFALGDLLNGQGRLVEAMQQYRAGLQQDP